VSLRVDLANPITKVAIEVDDPGHALRVRHERDQLRDAWLISQGWTVLRFSDREILDGLTFVMSMVMSSCGT
jgi:very-short-patch-repair endonuclease